MSFHALEVSFPMPHLPSYWQYKPAGFLAQFLGHEGPGSLHSYLKQKGWITGLSAGPQNLARGFGMFKVTLYMTPQGFGEDISYVAPCAIELIRRVENYEALVRYIFKYIALLKASEFPAWQQRERTLICATRFRFAEKRRPDDYAVWVSEHMAWPVPRELVLSAPQLVEEWNLNDLQNGGEKEMREILDSLTIEQSRTVLMAKAEEHERVRGKDLIWEKEPWYGTPYRVERFSEDFVKKANEPNDIKELYLPGPNEFIPTNLDVEKRDLEKVGGLRGADLISTDVKCSHAAFETPFSHPRNSFDIAVAQEGRPVLGTEGSGRHGSPEPGRVLIGASGGHDQVRNVASAPLGYSTERALNVRLYSDLVTDSLTEFAYDADLAGLTYNLSSQSLGLYVTLNGYNDKLHVLAKDVLERARNLKVQPDRLDVMKDQVSIFLSVFTFPIVEPLSQAKREYENSLLGSPFRLSNYYTRYMLSEREWTPDELLAEVNCKFTYVVTSFVRMTDTWVTAITPEELQAHITSLLSKLHIRMAVCGNMYKDVSQKGLKVVVYGY